MAEAYGSQFVTQFGPEPLPAWVAGLSVFSDDQIREGYTRAIADCTEFCPNLSVLIGYIKNDSDWEARRLHQPYDPDRALIDKGEGALLPPPTDDRSADEHLSDMKSLFN